MIRHANRHDKEQIIELMKQFRSESKLTYFQDIDNPEYWNRLLDSIFAGQGIIFYKEEQGLLMALISQSVWSDKHFLMHEMAWYVKPEFRHTTLAFKLMKSYVDYGKQLKKEKRIIGFTLSKLPTTPYLNYKKYGFEKMDENWIQ